MASVELRSLTKRYGAAAVVDDISLTIAHGNLVCLLGPSGCGKTTTLRLIAGFLEPDAGAIRVGERIVSAPGRTLPPERRNMSMIFQSYALWPHMTVGENVAYGLKLRKNDRGTIARKLKSILTTTHLEHLADRFRVVVFPVITGSTGRERIYDGYPDVALDMISSRTFDGRIQLLEYAPTILAGPPGTSRVSA